MNTCPTCQGPAHLDMAGSYWTTRSDSEMAQRIKELHSPEWIQTLCEHRKKGCNRADCTLHPNTIFGSNQYMHGHGRQICAHCTSGGDPYTAVSDEYPCPTLQALEGADE